MIKVSRLLCMMMIIRGIWRECECATRVPAIPAAKPICIAGERVRVALQNSQRHTI